MENAEDQYYAGLSKKERKKLRLRLRREAEEREGRKKGRKKRTKKTLLWTFIFIIILLIGYSIYSKLNATSQYDSFAKCLGEKTVVYGNDGCQYTDAQLAWFGKSAKYLNYVRCSTNKKLCSEKGIKITPTWEIDGKLYSGAQTFERLSSLSGCKI